ncbi:MAG: glutaminase [Planctomycetes bacterium]|nr:glutaminase [Planctomycetota bacterium]
MGDEPDYPAILAEIQAQVRPYVGQGAVADYIPELAKAPLDRWGLAVATLDGRVYTAGEAEEAFSIQSISKLFSLTLALQLVGPTLWERVGREPSGDPFNSLVQLEHEAGVPRNPFINAGALVVTDVIRSHVPDAAQAVLDLIHRAAGDEAARFDGAVAQSERETGHRNRAVAHFMKSFGRLRNDVDEVLDAYFHHCSISMSCADLARASLFLANRGRSPYTDEQLLPAEWTKYVNALMLTCGTYDAAGDFAFRVGLPTKSGVGGGLLAVMPQGFAACAWSPGLDRVGNSIAGAKALELLAQATGLSIF